MLHSRMKLAVIMITGALLLAPALSGCEEEGPAERLGERVDEAVDQAGDKVEDAAEKLNK